MGGERRVQESRPGAMNDIIEFHGVLIPACARSARTPRKSPHLAEHGGISRGLGRSSAACDLAFRDSKVGILKTGDLEDQGSFAVDTPFMCICKFYENPLRLVDVMESSPSSPFAKCLRFCPPWHLAFSIFPLA